MKITNLLMAAALTAAVGMSSVEGAERDRERGGSDDRRRGGNFGGRGDRPNFMQDMSQEQQQAMREVFMEMREKGQGTMQKIQRHRQELQELVGARTINEKAIRDKVMAIAELEADATIMRAKAFAKLRDAGVDESVLKMLTARMGGGQGMQRGGQGMQRGGGDRFQRGGGRGGFGDRPQGRPREGSKEDAKSKSRRPEFDQ